MSSISKSSGARAVVFGEVLWDCFEDGTEVLGGAPFNVAWNLRGFGRDPLFVSRIGDDDRGGRILHAMDEWGLDPRGVERDLDRPTGRVTVTLEDGSPTFRIEPEQAYDAVDGHGAAGSTASILYHGSLILRTAAARTTWDRLRESLGGSVFLDVNLREPWWDPASARAMLDGASFAKLNDDELARLAPPDAAGLPWPKQAVRLQEAHELSRLVVTRGAAGAAFFAPDCDPQRIPASPVSDLVDTVGAGDAFASVCIWGMLEDWPPAVTLARAGRFAARVCSIRGATTRDRSFYERETTDWRNNVEA